MFRASRRRAWRRHLPGARSGPGLPRRPRRRVRSALAARCCGPTWRRSGRWATCARPCGGCRRQRARWLRAGPHAAPRPSDVALRPRQPLRARTPTGPARSARRTRVGMVRRAAAGWYDDWVLDAREALQDRRADVLEDLAAASRAVGGAGDALMYATLAVDSQPLRETRPSRAAARPPRPRARPGGDEALPGAREDAAERDGRPSLGRDRVADGIRSRAGRVSGYGVLGGWRLTALPLPSRPRPARRPAAGGLPRPARPGAAAVLVAGSLWPDSSDRRANANLRSALWHARNECPDVVDGDGSTMWLCEGVAADFDEATGVVRAVLVGEQVSAAHLATLLRRRPAELVGGRG